MNTARNKCACGAASGCKGDCGCGCERCGESRCCELECLERPNFYCGQVLTDADLAAIVDWTRGRLALARFRDGWGIACGLELSCSKPDGATGCCDAKDASKGPSIYLNSGYALDCCGNDLVVCEPMPVDLACACRPPEDPCDPHRRRGRTEDEDDERDEGEEARQDCLHIPPGELFAVQLWLRYDEDLAQGSRALFRGPCADSEPCQYARVLERPCVHVEEIPLGRGEEAMTAEQRWLEQFRRGLKQQIDAIRAAFVKGSSAVLQHIRHYPPYRFCYLEETICCLRRKETPNSPIPDQQWLEIAKLVLLDWILRQLACPCPPCLPDNGVPLGRVILRRRVIEGRAHCSVVVIDQDAAFRRALRKDPCRPAGAASRDLAAFLGQPASRLQELRDQGLEFNIVDTQASSPRQLEQMIGSFGGSVVAVDSASPGALDVHLVDDIAGTPRIALFVSK